ncbi:hypothetical protein A2U01_0067683, partial [Trifolium medium]|nr:hypothetical protein [Trifolium medium]
MADWIVAILESAEKSQETNQQPQSGKPQNCQSSIADRFKEYSGIVRIKVIKVLNVCYE